MGETPGDKGTDGKKGAGSFEERLHSARVKQGLEMQPVAAGAGGSSPYGIGLRVGVELVSALAVAALIGWGLDRWLGTRPWLLALFIVLGGGAGIANVWRLMMPARTR